MMKEKSMQQLMGTHQMMCEACEIVPAAFLCKADSASLCAACDEAVHSANPLASRHHRVPIITSSTGNNTRVAEEKPAEDDDDDEAVSWLLLNPIVKNIDDGRGSEKALFGEEMVDYLDLEDYGHTSLKGDDDGFGNWWQQNECGYHHHVVPQKSFGNDVDDRYVRAHDSVVPIQQSNTSAASSQSNSFWWNQKAHEAGVEFVAEESINATTLKGTSNDLFLSPSTATQIPPTQLSPMEREARVLRYREKKKTRRFEKTIRYASRKAYAETRPRIKGRFAKRLRDARDNEADDDEVDQMFSSSLLTSEDSSYGVVPSFSLLCS